MALVASANTRFQNIKNHRKANESVFITQLSSSQIKNSPIKSKVDPVLEVSNNLPSQKYPDEGSNSGASSSSTLMSHSMQKISTTKTSPNQASSLSPNVSTHHFLSKAGKLNLYLNEKPQESVRSNISEIPIDNFKENILFPLKKFTEIHSDENKEDEVLFYSKTPPLSPPRHFSPKKISNKPYNATELYSTENSFFVPINSSGAEQKRILPAVPAEKTELRPEIQQKERIDSKQAYILQVILNYLFYYHSRIF